MSFSKHVRHVQEKCNRAINIIKFLRGTWWGAHPSTLLTFYKSYVMSIIDYGNYICCPTRKSFRTKLDRIQNLAVRLSLGYRNSTPSNILLAESKLVTLEERTKYLCKNFLIESLSNNNTQTKIIIKRFFRKTLFDNRQKISILRECIKHVIHLEHLIISNKQ